MIIAVDFDGTIVSHEFPSIGKDIGAFKWLKAFQDLGAKLILYTMRSDGGDVGNVLTQAVEYCRENGIEFWAINENPNQKSWTNSPKLYAQLYIDDAAHNVENLLINFNVSDKPYMDWDKVGPEVMKEIVLYKEKKAK